MLLSTWINSPVFVGEKQRGVLRNVFLSTKSKQIKYLQCTIQQRGIQSQLVVSVNAIERMDNNGIFLKRARSTLPKNAVLFQPNCPIYAENGVRLGVACDLRLQGLTAITLLTENAQFPTTGIIAIGDAILLKNEPYPIGQRIPAPLLSQFSTNQQDLLITRSILKTARKAGKLINLTLALPPFAK